MIDVKYNSQDEKSHSTILLSLSHEVLYEVVDEDTTTDHLDALNSILTDLKNVEVKIDDEDVTLIFLVSLPPSFENFELQKLNPPAYRFRIGVDIEHKKAKEKKGHWKFNYHRLKEKGQVAVVAKDDSGSERDMVLSVVNYKGTPLVCIMDSACSFI
ncbi:hypothetical protein Tco_1560101 [Tanacetum coccineum]